MQLFEQIDGRPDKRRKESTRKLHSWKYSRDSKQKWSYSTINRNAFDYFEVWSYHWRQKCNSKRLWRKHENNSVQHASKVFRTFDALKLQVAPEVLEQDLESTCSLPIWTEEIRRGWQRFLLSDRSEHTGLPVSFFCFTIKYLEQMGNKRFYSFLMWQVQFMR